MFVKPLVSQIAPPIFTVPTKVPFLRSSIARYQRPLIEIVDAQTLDLRAAVPIARAGELALGQTAELLIACRVPARFAGSAVALLGPAAARQLRADPWKLLQIPQIRPDQGAPMDAMRAEVFLTVPKVIEEATADFNRIFGRNYDPFVEKYKLADAEIAFFIMGAHANTARAAVDRLRKQGVKVGMARLRWVRPWPTHQLAVALGHVKAIGVVETALWDIAASVTARKSFIARSVAWTRKASSLS